MFDQDSYTEEEERYSSAEERQGESLEESPLLEEEMKPEEPLQDKAEASEVKRAKKHAKWKEYINAPIMVALVPLITFVVVLTVFSILWGYHYDRVVIETEKLEKLLEDSNNKSLFMTRDLIGYEQIDKIEEVVKSLGLPIESNNVPPYVIEVDKTRRR